METDPAGGIVGPVNTPADVPVNAPGDIPIYAPVSAPVAGGHPFRQGRTSLSKKGGRLLRTKMDP